MPRFNPPRELGLVVATLAVGVIAALSSPRFLQADNLRNILFDSAILILLATGQTLVIMTRNLDLSVASMVALVAFVTGTVYIEAPSIPVPGLIVLAMVLGLALGLVNGLLVAVLNAPAIIATLGTMSVFRGILFLIADQGQISRNELPDGLVSLCGSTLLGVPVIALFGLSVAAITAAVLRTTVAGRSILAVGGNENAARLRGINTQRVVLAVFATSGLLAGLAGIIFAGRYGNVNPSDANGLELQVIAAVVIGGTSVLGGSGTVLGTVIGSLLLITIANALVISDISSLWQLAIQGAIILVAAYVATRSLERTNGTPKARPAARGTVS